MTATALIAALATAGAGVMVPIRVIPGRDPIQNRQAPAASRSRKTGARIKVPVVIQVDVVDSEGHCLSGADVVVRLFYSRSSGNAEQVIERTKPMAPATFSSRSFASAQGTVLRGSVWAYRSGRALAMSDVSLTGKASPPAIQLTLNEPAKWTITVLGADERPIGGLRLAPHSLTAHRRPHCRHSLRLMQHSKSRSR